MDSIPSRAQRVVGGKTKSRCDKLSELAAKERFRAKTHTSLEIAYHDIMADCMCAASKRENELLYKNPIPKEVAYRLESVDNLTLEKTDEGTKISWIRG